MALQQLTNGRFHSLGVLCEHHAKEEHHVQTVLPKHFEIIWGNDCRYWRLPTACDPSAELIKVWWFDVKACVTIDPLKTTKVVVGFELSLTKDHYGWDCADLRIGAKVGEKGEYAYQSVCLSGLSPGIKVVVGVAFDLKKNSCTCDDKLHFGLFDIWSNKEKRGLKLYKAYVLDTTI